MRPSEKVKEVLFALLALVFTLTGTAEVRLVVFGEECESIKVEHL